MSPRTTTVKYGANDLRLAQSTSLSASVLHGSLCFEGTRQFEGGHRIPRPDRNIDDGIFSGWSTADGVVRAYSDRYGMWPLFYYFDGSRLVLSNQIHAIVEQCRPLVLDAEAIQVFLTLGFFLGESTPFAKVKVLPPRGELLWNGSDLKLTGTRDWSEPRHLSKAQALEGYVELFRQAIARRLECFGRPTAMLLSGGRDSRHILLELCRQGFPPDVCGTVRNAFSGRDESVLAASLCEAVDVKHESIHMAGSPHACHVVHAQATHLCADEHAWLTPAFAWLADRSCLSADGIAGDVLSASARLTPELHGLAKANKLRDAAQMLSERAILSGEHRAWLLAALEIQPNGFDPVDAIRSELTLCDNAGCPTASWYFWTRTRREIALAPFGLGQRVKTIFAPYLDADLFDFLTALPDWMLLEKTLHDDVIAAAYPALASIPYVPKQVPPKRRLRERLRLRLDREIGEARLFGHGHRRLIPRVSHRGLASWIAGLAHASGATTQDEAPAETGYTSAN